MGLSRVINEQLEDDCEVFIAEMGSRHVGDIRELCQLVEPQYGVITSIGAAHLETFGNIATVANAKFELLSLIHIWAGDAGGGRIKRLCDRF